MTARLFRDRREAGEKLAARLRSYRRLSPVVLGLPRGGVPVAYEVAVELDAPLDLCVVRKLGAPRQPERCVGAVGEDDALYVDREAVARLGVTERELERILERERAEVDERVRRLRRGAAPIPVEGRVVIIVDDGIATGGSARAAIETLSARGAARVVFAAPVGDAVALDELAAVADDVVCLHGADALVAIERYYDDFPPTSDDEINDLVERARAREREPARDHLTRSGRFRVPVARSLQIPVGDRVLYGKLSMGGDAHGLVIFAQGTGSLRHSPRTQYLASELQCAGAATLLFDLLAPEEGVVSAFTALPLVDLGLLATRLVAAIDWIQKQPELGRLRLGLFGAGAGSAVALAAAAERPSAVRAIVSWAGLPDLADAALDRVTAATLLLAGGADRSNVERNRLAFDRLAGDRRLEVLPRATRLLDEESALEIVARSAVTWFSRYFEASQRVTA